MQLWKKYLFLMLILNTTMHSAEIRKINFISDLIHLKSEMQPPDKTYLLNTHLGIGSRIAFQSALPSSFYVEGLYDVNL